MSASLRALPQRGAHVTAAHPDIWVGGDVGWTCAFTFPLFYFFYIVGLKNELLLMSYLNPF